jgi:ribosomal protein L37AE/L43A
MPEKLTHPKQCPSCKVVGSLVDAGEEWHCTDRLCGHSFSKEAGKPDESPKAEAVGKKPEKR